MSLKESNEITVKVKGNISELYSKCTGRLRKKLQSV